MPPGRKPRPVFDRWVEKVDLGSPPRGENVPLSDCWEWTASKDKGGLSMFGFKYNGKQMQGGHKFSQLYFNGPIPEGHQIRHKCHNPGCVNPEHLHTGTFEQNKEDKLTRKVCRKHFRREEKEMIYEYYESGELTIKEIAEAYTTTQSAIKHILQGGW